MQRSDKSRKTKFPKFATYEALIYKNIFRGKFLEGTRNARNYENLLIKRLFY